MFTYHVAPHALGIDPWSTRGVAVDRNAAHLIVAALRRDAYSLRERGGEANIAEATDLESIAQKMMMALR